MHEETKPVQATMETSADLAKAGPPIRVRRIAVTVTVTLVSCPSHRK